MHWNRGEGAQRAVLLREKGYRVGYPGFNPTLPFSMAKVRDNPPDAFVIDLSRLPSSGRDVAMALRSYKQTRSIPLVFVGGLPQKVTKIRGQLPDAIFTSWEKVGESLRAAIEHPPAVEPRSRSRLEGYSRTPLPKKLGIKKDSAVSLVHPPLGFLKMLSETGELPEGVKFHNRAVEGADVTVWFVYDSKQLMREVGSMLPFSINGGLSIAWPKKASQMPSDLSEAVVRKCGLEAGMVDFKICSVDATWSALRFSSRKK